MHRLTEKHLTRMKGLKAESTYKGRRSDLRDFDQWAEEQGHEITDMTPLDLEEYFIGVKGDGYAPNTIATRYESVRTLFNFLTDKLGKYEDNPFDGLEKNDYANGNSRKHDESDLPFVTRAEKELLCEHAPSPRLRNELMIRMMFQTGVRQGELTDIRVQDLDREDRSIEVWASKTNESRKVFYHESLDLLMDQWLDGGYRDSYAPGEESEYLFVTHQSEKFDRKRPNKIVKPAAESAGIQEEMYEDMNGHTRYRITSHALRHGAARAMLLDGIDLRNLQLLLGHSKLDTTEKYLSLLDDDVAGAYRKFDPRPDGAKA